MQKLPGLVASVTIGLMSALPLSASTAADGPAEAPPATFTGRQYVDSQGCVYIRAEVGGAVTWAPRLTPRNEVLCGFEPTFGGGGVAATGSLPTVQPDTPPVVSEAPPASDIVAVQETASNGVAARPVATAPVVAARPVAAQKVVRRVVKPAAQTGIPAGYRPVWDDDRLNPLRAKGTASGEAAMRRKWTDTVPMKLITN